MLHVLEVETNSPAELAGLVPYKDYLLGTAEKVSCFNIILMYRLIQRESIYLCNWIFIVSIVYICSSRSSYWNTKLHIVSIYFIIICVYIIGVYWCGGVAAGAGGAPGSTGGVLRV